MTPNQRSKRHAESLGYKVAIVERWNAFAKVRNDLFGIGDLLCIRAGSPVLLVQATTDSNMSTRVKKVTESEHIGTWCGTGSVFEVWGWGKHGPRGGKKQWVLKVQSIYRS